jgi:hypothetical protein
MEFAQVTYTKTVEGNFDVQLIHNNTVIAHITFPTEELAKEYVDIKTKLKAHADALIAEVTANLTKAETEVKFVASKVETKVADVAKVVETGAEKVEDKVENFVGNMKNRIEKAKGIDTSAKVGTQPIIDTSVKVGKDTTIDTSAKIVVPE